MARRVEGTIAFGFRCDCHGCTDNAIWAAIICTPYLRNPQEPPILTFTDIHVCHDHWRHVKRDITSDPMREAIRQIADQKGGKPDFDRQFLSRIGVHHPDYQKFQGLAGLIPQNDQVLDKVIDLTI